MNGGLLYALGTAATWAGWALALRAAYLFFVVLAKPPGRNLDGVQKGLLGASLAAAGLLIFALALPMQSGRPASGSASVPIVWFVMPYSAWFVAASAVFVVLRLVQAWMALNDIERRARVSSAAIWSAFGAVSYVLYLGSPSVNVARGFPWMKFVASDNKVEILKGAVPMSITLLVALFAAALASLAAMALVSRATSTRGASKAFVTHIALVAGSIIFGLPFAWLVVTSFKEDKDIASTDGLKWTPYVGVMVKYDDPNDPLYEGRYQGRDVQGTYIETERDGRIKIDIIRPLAMRGLTFADSTSRLNRVPKDVPVVTGTYNSKPYKGMVIQEFEDGSRKVRITSPADLAGTEYKAQSRDVKDVRKVGVRWENYTDALDFLPPETARGLVYLKNTLILVIMSIVGVVISCTLVAYAFSRLRFPGRDLLFNILLSTMMLPGAVTLLPTFLIFRSLGWIDTLYPMWVPAFFAGAFNVFLLRQFFMTIPMELEDAAKIDGCTYLRTIWQVMVPQIKPALAAISIFTAMGAWNNFMGPLIYISSPERMPIAYAVQLFQSDRGGEAGLMMAFATMAMIPVLLLFFFAQRYFIEGVTLSGFGGR